VAEKVWEKLLGIINDQGSAMAEPFLEKVLDLAFEFELKNGKATYLGISRFFTDGKGQYQGNSLNGWSLEIDSEIAAFAETLPEMIIKPLVKSIECSLLANYYEGNFGVDTLIFCDEKNDLRVNPCLEINVRQNMGLLSQHLEKLISPNKTGVFKTFYNPKQSFFEFKKEMQKTWPLKLRNSKIESGFFPVIPNFKNTLFGAYILVKD
jgi:hypothetical protein